LIRPQHNDARSSGIFFRPPHFLENNGQGWELDFATMNQVTRMNPRNMGHFTSREHSYMFGFADWKFDANGFPVAGH